MMHRRLKLCGLAILFIVGLTLALYDKPLSAAATCCLLSGDTCSTLANPCATFDGTPVSDCAIMYDGPCTSSNPPYCY